jgi:7-cyano-7-deazaguanine synthase
MCSVHGVLTSHGWEDWYREISDTWEKSQERGRDSWGVFQAAFGRTTLTKSPQGDGSPVYTHQAKVMLGNRRAEPTTEWVERKRECDCQPYRTENGWTYVLNGTISNDRELKQQLINAETVTHFESEIDTTVLSGLFLHYAGMPLNQTFDLVIHALQGSFAVIAWNVAEPEQFYVACNYKPLWIRYYQRPRDESWMVQIASQERFLQHENDHEDEPKPFSVPPYSWGIVPLTARGRIIWHSLYPKRVCGKRKKVLAVCSGGLDSSVAAWLHHQRGDDVTLFHIAYNCRAEGQEIESIKKLAAYMEVPYVVIETNFFQQSASSPLTDPNADIQSGRGGEAGAEFAHEWVPARNTVMLSLALAYAEAHDYEVLMLGNNLEESGGGYPDNEEEFINRFQALAPYSLKAYHKIEFSQPFGNKMKREIVAAGLESEAPMELTWSCYHGGEGHCGNCGPCYMRQKAFLMNNALDPVFTYQLNESGSIVAMTGLGTEFPHGEPH